MQYQPAVSCYSSLNLLHLDEIKPFSVLFLCEWMIIYLLEWCFRCCAAHLGGSVEGRAHTSLAVVLTIITICGLVAVALFLYKKSGRHLPAFENTLYFNGEHSQPDLVNTNKLIENVEEAEPEPMLTLWREPGFIVQSMVSHFSGVSAEPAIVLIWISIWCISVWMLELCLFIVCYWDL